MSGVNPIKPKNTEKIYLTAFIKKAWLFCVTNKQANAHRKIAENKSLRFIGLGVEYKVYGLSQKSDILKKAIHLATKHTTYISYITKYEC